MRARTLLAALIALGLLGLVGEASAGWFIEQVVKNGDDGRQQVFVESNRMKTLMLEPNAQPGSAFIVDLKAETITTVDYRERSYTSGTMDDYIDAVRTLRQTAGRQLAEMKKKMEAAMKDMPPEQRHAMEQMMRQHLGQADSGEQDCPERDLELRPTSQVATIAGFQATRHDLLMDGVLDSQVWLARGITAWREFDLQRLQRFMARMAAVDTCSPGSGGPAGAAAWRVVKEGYPVRVVDTSGAVVEVVKAESRPIPAAEFQPPAGFARKAWRGTPGG